MSPEHIVFIQAHPIAALLFGFILFIFLLLIVVCASARLGESCFPEEMEGFQAAGREDCYTCEHSGHKDDPMCENCSALKVEHFSNWQAKQ